MNVYQDEKKRRAEESRKKKLDQYKEAAFAEVANTRAKSLQKEQSIENEQSPEEAEQEKNEEPVKLKGQILSH